MPQHPAELERAAEIARRMKRDLVARYGDGADPELCDLIGFCVVVRAGEQVAICHEGPGPESARRLVYWAACLFCPDELVFVADARFRALAADETIKHGEIQDAWEAGQRAGITEALVVTSLSPSQAPRLVAFPYERQGKILRWLPVMSLPYAIDGAIVEHARLGFAAAEEQVWERERRHLRGEELSDAVLDAILDRDMARVASEKPDITRVSLLAQGLSYVNGEEVPFPS